MSASLPGWHHESNCHQDPTTHVSRSFDREYCKVEMDSSASNSTRNLQQSSHYDTHSILAAEGPAPTNAGLSSNRQNRHPTLLEPPFSYADRPSSPRHHSTNIASALSQPTTTTKPSTAQPDTPLTPQLPESAPTLWPDDEITLPRLRPGESFSDLVGWPQDALDHFYSSEAHHQLSDFANQDFSSPSAYPSFTGLTHEPLQDLEFSRGLVNSHPTFVHHNTTDNEAPTFDNLLSVSASASFATAPQTTQSLLSDVSESQFHSFQTNYNDSLATSFASDTMPPTTRRRLSNRSDTANPNIHVNKRQRTIEPGRTQHRRASDSHRKSRAASNDDPFGDLNDEDPASTKREDGEEPLMIDLTDTSAIKEDSRAASEPKEDNRIKLATFQCVICMDNVTTLTVTYCGKLYPPQHYNAQPSVHILISSSY